MKAAKKRRAVNKRYYLNNRETLLSRQRQRYSELKKSKFTSSRLAESAGSPSVSPPLNEPQGTVGVSSHVMNTRSIQRALQGHSGPRVESLSSREPSMRIGSEFQAIIPELAGNPPLTGGPDKRGVGSIMVWMPTDRLSDDDIDAYLAIAKEKFGYGTEQALGMLYWHGYCIDKALEHMPNFCPLKDEWSMEDKVIFQQAFQYHGKNFQRIRAMLPDKPISSLVKYYYLWKRSYTQYSLMDKQSRRNCRRLGAGLPVSNDDTDSNKSGSSRSDPHHHSGGYHSSLLYQHHPQHHAHLSGSGAKGKQLPKGIYLSTMELLDLSNDEDSANTRRLDREILELKKKLQDCKQLLSSQREEEGGDESMEGLRPCDYSRKTGSNTPTKWSDDEIEIALEVIKEHGKDCEALSMALENKTIAQCRNFFTNYKRKLNLPRLIAEYEIKNGHKLSRYGRQAKELVENGGEGLGHASPSTPPHPHPQAQYPDSKRPCYDSRGGGGQSAGVTTYATPPQLTMGLV